MEQHTIHEKEKIMIRFRVEFSNGTRITLLANTEEEAYFKASNISNYEIVEIWND